MACEHPISSSFFFSWKTFDHSVIILYDLMCFLFFFSNFASIHISFLSMACPRRQAMNLHFRNEFGFGCVLWRFLHKGGHFISNWHTFVKRMCIDAVRSLLSTLSE